MHSIIYRTWQMSTSLVFVIFMLAVTGCKKLVEVEPPVTRTTGASVYNSDATAIAAVTGIYTNLSAGNIATGESSITLYAGLSADELSLWSGISSEDVLTRYYSNQLFSNTLGADPGTQIWRAIYPIIFVCNSAIEGLTASNSLTEPVKRQLLGESKFMRAFLYFYLTNLYGDIPLLLSTDYQKNSLLAKVESNEVYSQIIDDLIAARESLSESYLDASLTNQTSERIRPNKATAQALLARVYLYSSEWQNAELESTALIDNFDVYSLTDLSASFKRNSDEAIWQLQPVVSGWNTLDARLFLLPDSGPNNGFPANPVYLSSNLLNSFEPGDFRRLNTGWVDSVDVAGTTYYFPSKYKVGESSSLDEYLTVFRLAEQFLIRAEARAQLGKLAEALDDLNAVRSRAGLGSSTANDLSSLQSAIIHERQVELFTEWGHRWLDLKRTNTIDQVMELITPSKSNGQAWQSYQQLYPLPLIDIQRDPNLIQTPGY